MVKVKPHIEASRVKFNHAPPPLHAVCVCVCACIDYIIYGVTVCVCVCVCRGVCRGVYVYARGVIPSLRILTSICKLRLVPVGVTATITRGIGTCNDRV